MNEYEKSLLIQKLRSHWDLPTDLFGKTTFGNGGCEIIDFEPEDYVYFLDNVKNLENMIEGFRCLSPLADDALKVAESMGKSEFNKFKKLLSYERHKEETRTLSKKYLPLVIPKRFFDAYVLSEEYQVSLGIALIRLAELE